MHTPSALHWTTLKRVLQYLKGMVHYGLRLLRHSGFHLSMYSDVDWVGDVHDHVSRFGYLLFLVLNPISWPSKKQSTISRSSIKA